MRLVAAAAVSGGEAQDQLKQLIESLAEEIKTDPTVAASAWGQ
jgi:hypothetical protein